MPRERSWVSADRAPLMAGVEREVWLVPVVFALHVVEEAPGFTAWARRHASERYTHRDFVCNNALGMLSGVAATAALARRPAPALAFAWYVGVLGQQIWNTAFHVGTTAAWRTYSPGLVSSMVLHPLVWLRLHTRVLGRRTALTAFALAGALHALVVARQVFFWRAGRSGAHSSGTPLSTLSRVAAATIRLGVSRRFAVARARVAAPRA